MKHYNRYGGPDIKLLVLLMDNAACALDVAREYEQISLTNKSYWRGAVEFWEKELGRSIDDLRFAYHHYLKGWA